MQESISKTTFQFKHSIHILCIFKFVEGITLDAEQITSVKLL